MTAPTAVGVVAVAALAGFVAGVGVYVFAGWLQQRAEDRNLPGLTDEAASWLAGVGEG